MGLLRTGYAALSLNGAMEKPGSEATCFSLRSEEARAAASGANALKGKQGAREANCLLQTVTAHLLDYG